MNGLSFRERAPSRRSVVPESFMRSTATASLSLETSEDGPRESGAEPDGLRSNVGQSGWSVDIQGTSIAALEMRSSSSAS